MNQTADGRRRIVFYVLLFIPIAVVICFALFNIFSYNDFEFHSNCNMYKAVIHSQWLENRYTLCDNCLFMNVTQYIDINNRIGKPWNTLLYFGDEFVLRKDLPNESEIWINWCWIDSVQDYRVRGITNMSEVL